MKITFFSTNSSFFSKNTRKVRELPARKSEWQDFSKKYPEIEVNFVIQRPGRYLLDEDGDGALKTTILPENFSTAQIAGAVLSEKPDLAVPVTYWEAPFDWLSLRDSGICSILEKNGTGTASHTEYAARTAFSKAFTRDFFMHNSFRCARGVFVHHELYWAERRHREICTNAYKESVLSMMGELSPPYVVKDTTGLSSYGMDVCRTYAEAVHVLNSKKNNGDRIVEEFIEGLSFGIEIYGSRKKYAFSPLFINSVNQFGLTSPKQNVKLGPVENGRFKIHDLHRELERLAIALDLNGICQIDLIFSGGLWHFVEINSRISGMTESAALAMNLSLPELLFYSSVLGKSEFEGLDAFLKIQGKIKKSFVMNMKFPLLSEEKLQKLHSARGVYRVNQIENLEARQKRESGYAEILLGTPDGAEELFSMLEEIKKTFPDDIEDTFYRNAIELAETTEML